MMRRGILVSFAAGLALTAGASLQDECQRLVDEAVAAGEQGGVQFCAYRDGKCIVDVCAGRLATNAGAAVVRSDSLFPIFSTEKPLLSTAVHRAVELGKMDYDKPLCTWWPEFRGGRKDALTLRMTLAYRSGLNGGIPKAFKRYEEVGDWKNLCDAFAKEDCEIEPGTKQRYMPDSYGWTLGHPLEVAMGRPFVEVLDELVLGPCGIADEFYYVQGEREFPRIATLYGDDYTACMNREWARRALEPASFAVSSARALAKFYNRLCGFDGKPPLIRKETLDMALEPSRHRSDPLPSEAVLRDEKRYVMIFGTGYGLWGPCGRLGRVFGHAGCGGSEALCDRDRKLVVAFTCNFNNYKGGLRRRLYDAVGMRWRYSTGKDADIQTLQMNTRSAVAAGGYSFDQHGGLRLPCAGLKEPVRFWVIADSHLNLRDERDAQYAENCKWISGEWGGKITCREAFLKILKEAKEQKPDLLVMAGDMINFPTLANIEFAKRELDACGIPWIYVAGNHDWHLRYEPGKPEDLRRKWTTTRMAPLYQGTDPRFASRVVKGVRFVTIDNSLHNVTPEQTAFFRAEAAKGDPVCLVMHIPFWHEGWGYDTCACPDWEKRDRGWETQLLGAPRADRQDESTFAFRAAVESTPNLVGVFAGHVHHWQFAQDPTVLHVTATGAMFGECLKVTLGTEDKRQKER